MKVKKEKNVAAKRVTKRAPNKSNYEKGFVMGVKSIKKKLRELLKGL